MKKIIQLVLFPVIILVLLGCSSENDFEDDAKFVRLVKIKIDKSRVEEYIPILKKTNEDSNINGKWGFRLSRS